LAGCWFADQAHHPGVLAAPEAETDAFISRAAAELDAYWQDAAVAHFSVPLDPQGTPFQQAVWQALLAIPAGSATSYGALARLLGRPQALRAVGAAVGRNPVGILIPCHRAGQRRLAHRSCRRPAPKDRAVGARGPRPARPPAAIRRGGNGMSARHLRALLLAAIWGACSCSFAWCRRVRPVCAGGPARAGAPLFRPS
jgi:O-6-methylguanine DNA methyltransferase